MDVQLTIPFETLVSLVKQLPDGEKQTLIERVQAPAGRSELSAELKIARLQSIIIDADVIEVPSIRREDWYDDDGR